MKLIIASNNKHKIEEIKAILENEFDEILTLSEAGINHETIEDGNTFSENAYKKAREISEISGCASLADDSGLCVEALDGAPGIYSARYSGKGQTENNKLLLSNMKDKQNRNAHFTCAAVLVFPDGRAVKAEGYMHGSIAEEESGNGGFGYDPLFIPAGYTKTVAELSEKEKNSISHRKNALSSLFLKLRQNIN